MSPDDREMMKKIFGDVDDSFIEQQDAVHEVLDGKQSDFAINLLMSFQQQLTERFQQDHTVFLAPPSNFSFMEN